MIIFSSFEVGMNFLIKACFFLHFKKLLRKFEFEFYFFSYFKLIFFFYVFVLFWCDDKPKEPYPTKFEFSNGAGPNVYESCQRWWSYPKQDPTLKGPGRSRTQNRWVCFQQHPTQMGPALSRTQSYLDPAGGRTKHYWVMLEQDAIMMSPDAVGPKAILGYARGRTKL
jgi:hypothetical protein